MHQTEVIAHRGASAYAPENTMAAFKLAHAMGADWFELDCQLTGDGEVVVLHDGDLDRTTNGAGPAIEATLADIRALDAGAWYDDRFRGEPVPALGDALDFAKGRIGVYVEIKSIADDKPVIGEILTEASGHPVADEALKQRIIKHIEAGNTPNLVLARKTIAEIRQRNMQDEVVIQSFSPIICAVAAIEAPEIRVEVLAVDDEDDPSVWKTYERFLYLLRFDGLNTNASTLTEGRLAALQAAGKSVAIWTVNDPDAMRRYAGWGVDRIITDKPDVCLQVLDDLGQRATEPPAPVATP